MTLSRVVLVYSQDFGWGVIVKIWNYGLSCSKSHSLESYVILTAMCFPVRNLETVSPPISSLGMRKIISNILNLALRFSSYF